MECLLCEKPIAKFGKKFCSLDCYQEYKREIYNKKYTKNCVICNTQFRCPSTSPNNKTCSKGCMKILMSRKHLTEKQKTKISETLKTYWKNNNGGNRKGVILTDEHKEKIRKSCKGINKGPKNAKYIDGKASIEQYKGEDWNYIRKQVYKRDNWTCQKCFKTHCRVDAHHIVPWRITKDNRLENLITLCASCHKKEDNRIIKEQKQHVKHTNSLNTRKWFEA